MEWFGQLLSILVASIINLLKNQTYEDENYEDDVQTDSVVSVSVLIKGHLSSIQTKLMSRKIGTMMMYKQIMQCQYQYLLIIIDDHHEKILGHFLSECAFINATLEHN